MSGWVDPRVEDWITDRPVSVMLPLILLSSVVLLAVILGPIVWWASRQPSITLQKAEWSCTVSHTEYMPVMVGKVMTMQPHTVCDKYERSQ